LIIINPAGAAHSQAQLLPTYVGAAATHKLLLCAHKGCLSQLPPAEGVTRQILLLMLGVVAMVLEPAVVFAVAPTAAPS